MSFQQALSGLDAASKSLGVIGNNVANASTVGFKGSQAQFADVYANSLGGGGGSQIGIGTKVMDVAQQFTQGNITTSNNPLDLAINGKGFFRLSNNGDINYSRNGQFHVDRDGYIVNADELRLTGYPVAAGGALASGAVADLRIPTNDIAPQTTTELEAVLNLDSRAAALPPAGFNLNDPTTYHSSSSTAVYDSLGNAHTLSLYYLKTAANSWDVFAGNDGVQVGAGSIGTLNFQSNGSIDTATTTLPLTVSAPVATGAATPLTFDVDFPGTTQYGAAFGVNSLTQDGFSSGRLSGFTVDDSGIVLGRYSNGQSATLGQVVLANFANPQGLQPLGDNLWAESFESGSALVGAPNTGGLGTMQSAAVEDSNVDLTAELVNMITAQRVYQANAQTIKTQDAVLQTLVNLR